MDIRLRHIIISFVVLALLVILAQPNILSIAFVFLFMGIVPGTDITLPSWVTIVILLIALGFGLRWLFDQPVYHPISTDHDKSQRHSARKRVLKKTSGRRKTARHYRKQAAKA